jgi:hypothetical protein
LGLKWMLAVAVALPERLDRTWTLAAVEAQQLVAAAQFDVA